MSEAPSKEELWEHFDHCLAEYRFQVELNWKRTQYFFALNVAVVAAAAGLLSNTPRTDQPFLIMLFLVGFALATFSIAATRIQKGYYSEARDLVKAIQAQLPLGDLAIRTTPGMGSARPRWRRVGQLQEWMFMLIAAVDLSGLVVVIVHWV